MPLIQKSGSIDYQNASIPMKKTLSKVVGEYLEKDLKKIKHETLIIWGKNDQETPYRDALKLKRKIKNSGTCFFRWGWPFPIYCKRKEFLIKL